MLCHHVCFVTGLTVDTSSWCAVPAAAAPKACLHSAGDRGSEYDSIRAQSASLMVQTPISSSPFLNRRKLGSAQSSGAQLGHAPGGPGRLSLGPGNLSRFAQLEASPMPSPLALTPVMKPQRTTPR